MHFKTAGSILVAASIALGASIANAADLPSPIVLSSPAHEVTVNQVKTGLEALGYTNIGTVTTSGSVITTTADFGGKSHNLRINGDFGTVFDADVMAADDRDLPGPVRFASAAHETDVNEARTGLENLGYDVRTISQDGTIFTARADFGGETLDLRVEAGTGQVTMIGAGPADAGGLPSIRLATAAHETTRNQISVALSSAGYEKVRNVSNDGRIYSANAEWQGTDMALRIDARSGLVTPQ